MVGTPPGKRRRPTASGSTAARKQPRQPRMTSRKGVGRCNSGARNCPPTAYEFRQALAVIQRLVTANVPLIGTVGTLVERTMSPSQEESHAIGVVAERIAATMATMVVNATPELLVELHLLQARHQQRTVSLFEQFLFLLDELLADGIPHSWADEWASVVVPADVDATADTAFVDMVTVGHNLMRVLLLANSVLSYAGRVGTTPVRKLSATVGRGRHPTHVAMCYRLEPPFIPTVAEFISFVYELNALMAVETGPSDGDVVSRMDESNSYPTGGNHLADKDPTKWCAVAGIAVRMDVGHLVSGVPEMVGLVAGIAGVPSGTEAALQGLMAADLSKKQYKSMPTKKGHNGICRVKCQYTEATVRAALDGGADGRQLSLLLPEGDPGNELLRNLQAMRDDVGYMMYEIFANLLSVKSDTNTMSCAFTLDAGNHLTYNRAVVQQLLTRCTGDTRSEMRRRLEQDQHLRAHVATVTARLAAALPAHLDVMSGAACPPVVNYNTKDPTR